MIDRDPLREKATDGDGNKYTVLNLADTHLISKYRIDEAYRYRSAEEEARDVEAKNMMVHLNELFGPTAFLTSHGVGKYGRVLGDLWFRVDRTHWVNAAQLMVGEKLASPTTTASE